MQRNMLDTQSLPDTIETTLLQLPPALSALPPGPRKETAQSPRGADPVVAEVRREERVDCKGNALGNYPVACVIC